MPKYYIALAGDGFDEIPDGWYGVARSEDDELLAIFKDEELCNQFMALMEAFS